MEDPLGLCLGTARLGEVLLHEVLEGRDERSRRGELLQREHRVVELVPVAVVEETHLGRGREDEGARVPSHALHRFDVAPVVLVVFETEGITRRVVVPEHPSDSQ